MDEVENLRRAVKEGAKMHLAQLSPMWFSAAMLGPRYGGLIGKQLRSGCLVDLPRWMIRWEDRKVDVYVGRVGVGVIKGGKERCCSFQVTVFLNNINISSASTNYHPATIFQLPYLPDHSRR